MTDNYTVQRADIIVGHFGINGGITISGLSNFIDSRITPEQRQALESFLSAHAFGDHADAIVELTGDGCVVVTTDTSYGGVVETWIPA